MNLIRGFIKYIQNITKKFLYVINQIKYQKDIFYFNKINIKMQFLNQNTKYQTFILINFHQFYKQTQKINQLIIINLLNKQKKNIIRMEKNQQQILAEFRTVVTGYRLHGILVSREINQEVFQLRIQSTTNKQEVYHLEFDNTNLNSSNLNKCFKSPKQFYQYLSKMTKTKVKFNTQKKILFVITQKQKILNQIPINLVISSQKAQKIEISTLQPYEGLRNNQSSIEQCTQQQKSQQTNFTLERQQRQQNLVQTSLSQKVVDAQQKSNKQFAQSQQKNSNKQQSHVSAQQQKPKAQQQASYQPIDIMAKIQQLKRIRKNQLSKQQSQKPKRQMKAVSINFNKKQNQTQNLYEFSFSKNLQILTNLIQNEQIQKASQIILKRSKLQLIPPLNQLYLLNIVSLSLQQNKIQKIVNLQTLENLQKLNLDGNKIRNIQNISHFTKLKVLKLGNNQIQKIQNLNNLFSLQTLWLDFNNIQKIQNLNGLKNLKSLNLSFNMIKKIQNLDQLNNLQELLISIQYQNQIKVIENLQNLMKLTKLSLNMNSIQRISGVKKLLLLEMLSLFQNQIQQFDRQAFEEINWLKMLKQLRLGGNYIQWGQQQKGYIDRLVKYGVKVNR